MTIVKLIETDAEYEAALARIDALFDAPKDTPESQELALLVVLVNHYEAIHYPIPPADPVEATKYRMEELGWTYFHPGPVGNPPSPTPPGLLPHLSSPIPDYPISNTPI